MYYVTSPYRPGNDFLESFNNNFTINVYNQDWVGITCAGNFGFP